MQADGRTGYKKTFVMKDLVCISRRICKKSSYDTRLHKLCDGTNIKRFCMHALRQTYAARAIESGMQIETIFCKNGEVTTY